MILFLFLFRFLFLDDPTHGFRYDYVFGNQGDVFARVGEDAVGVMALSEGVDDIDARVTTLEAHSLNQRVTSLEDEAQELSKEITAVNATQATLLDASASTLRAEAQAAQEQAGENRDELRHSLQTRIADVQAEALEESQNVKDNANSAISSAAASLEAAVCPHNQNIT